MQERRSESWHTKLTQHFKVFGIAIVFGLGAYAFIRLFIYVNHLIGLG